MVGVRTTLATVALMLLSGSAFTVASWPAFTLLTSTSATEVVTTMLGMFVSTMNPLELEEVALEPELPELLPV
ncbi:hypothetical protein [Amycolatopsis sp.]|uniref:hypothetical protein n=1 Tax=Amycolatopsis sp. TaxID=37632 RepID=UPI002C26F44B|nr:hypothetical protein [Amycolatopsis sp.]HVV11842.1 hypothetical protein [Amycolatopsis sp.]